MPMGERDTEVCEDCAELIDGSRNIEPHRNMRVIRLAHKMAFGCFKCGTGWERTPLGWEVLPQPS